MIAVDGLYTSRPLAAADFELAPGNRLDLDLQIPANFGGKEIVVTDHFTRRPFAIASLHVSGKAVSPPTFSSPAAAHVPAWQESVDLTPVTSILLNAQRGGPLQIAWTLNRVAHGKHPSVELPLGKFAGLRFTNESYRLHPMHIHGMFFKVLARNGSPVDEPFFRDTALVHSKETVDIGLVPLDAGRWMLHCHVLEHAEAGMMTTVMVPAT